MFARGVGWRREIARGVEDAAPYSTREFWPRRGPDGERAKSVKKNAALLHFLAFGPLDHNFGVPRGE